MNYARWIAVLVMVCVVFSGCALPSEPTNPADTRVVTITFGASESERALFTPFIEQFNRQNPDMHVQFVAVAAEIGPQESANPMLDLARAADTAILASVRPEDIRRGYLRDLKPLMDADATFNRADFYSTALQGVTLDGAVAAIPRTVSVPLIQYNKTLWAKQGLSAPKPDWSWRDVAAAAEALARKNGNKIETYGLVDWTAGVAAVYGELNEIGTSISSGLEPALDTPALAQAVERVAGLAQKGAVFLPEGGFDSDGFRRVILDQRVGMWQYGALYLNPQDPKPTFDIGVAAYPAIPPTLLGSIDGYVMSAGTQHPQEAWRWLSFLSRQQVTRQFDDPTRPDVIPARIALAEQSGYWKNLDAQTDAAVKAMLARPVEPLDMQVSLILSQVIGDVARGRQTAQQALAQAQTQARGFIARDTANKLVIAVATPVPQAVETGVTTITFANIMGSSSQMEQLVRRFNQEHADIRVVLKPLGPIGAPLTLNNLADIADCFPSWGAPSASERNAVLNLQPLLDGDAGFPRTDYPPVLLAPYQYNGALYGLPYGVYLRFIAYNQDVFARTGVEAPQATWTLDDLRAAAQRLTSGEGESKRYGYTGPTLDDLFFFLDRLGAQPFTGTGENARPNFTDARVQQAIQVYLDTLKSYSPHKRLIGYEQGDNEDNGFSLFAQGRSAMFASFATGMDRPGGFTTVFAPPPFGANGPTANDVLPSVGLYISAKTPHQAACWTWLKYLSGDAALMLDGFPARISLAESAAFQQRLPQGANDVYQAYRRAWDGGSTTTPTFAFYAEGRDRFYWLFRAVDRTLGGADLSKELDQAQYLTGQYLACVRSGESPAGCPSQVDPTYNGYSKAEAKK